MSRYIDKDEAEAIVRNCFCDDCYNYNGVRCRACYVDKVLGFIDIVPTADVVEVRHGKWIPTDSRRRKRNFECSECKNAIHVPKEEFVNKYALYCLRCGAKNGWCRMSDRVCCNCGNCQRIPLKEHIETRCAIDDHYIGYLECFTQWCRHWKRERKWDEVQNEDNRS